jgi:hypothetical protein
MVYVSATDRRTQQQGAGAPGVGKLAQVDNTAALASTATDAAAPAGVRSRDIN